MHATFAAVTVGFVQGLRGIIDRCARLVGVLAVACVFIAVGALPADADTQWKYTRYDVNVVLDDAGTARVTVDFTFDLASGGHGPLLTLVTQQGWDAQHDRTYTYDDIEVTSATAPDDLDVRAGERELELRVGDPDVTVRGRHDYTLTYTARGLVNGASSTKDGDQLYWNVLTDVSVPIRDVTATVRAPGAVTDVVCHAGAAGYRGGCNVATSKGKTATFAAELIPRGGAMTIVAVTEAGVLGDPEPLLVPTTTQGAALRPIFNLAPGETLSFLDRGVSTLDLGGMTTKLAVTALGGSALAAAALLVRRGRDRFAAAPAASDDALRAMAVQTAPVTSVPVSSVPTSSVQAAATVSSYGLAPLPYPAAEIGVLADGRVDNRDLLAAVLDLARRGYVQLETTGQSPRSPLKIRTIKDADDALSPFDRAVLEVCPQVDQSIELTWTLDMLASRSARLRAELDADVTARGWFLQAPGRRRAQWWAAGRALQRFAWWGTLAAIAIQLVRGTEVLEGIVWVGLGLWLAGGTVRLISRRAVGVTALGASVRREVSRYRHQVRALRRDARLTGDTHLDEHLPALVALGEEKAATRAVLQATAAGVAVTAPRWATGWDDNERFYRDLPRRTRRARRAIDAEEHRRRRASSGTSSSGSTHGSSGGSGRRSSSSGSGSGGGRAGGW